MKITIYRYKLDFKNPFRIAGKTIESRSGLIFRLESPHGVVWAEASPLQGFSNETVKELIEILEGGKSWYMMLQADELPDFDQAFPPSLAYALSVLWYGQKAIEANQPLPKFIDPAAETRVDVNAAIGLGTEENVMRAARTVIQEGYHTIKLKVGENFEHEFELLSTIRNSYPGLKIRIDANQSWDPDTALANLKRLEPLDIEYCEQPIPVSSNDKLSSLKKNTTVKIAADESIRNYKDAMSLIENDSVDIIVLKPMLIGSIGGFLDIIRAADKTPAEVVVTTTLETGIGRRIVAGLASLVTNSPYAHGLSTGYLFEYDIMPDKHLIKNGRYDVFRIDFDRPDMHLLEHVLTVD